MGAKDKNAPKRPLSGYFRFIATIRSKVTEETGKKGIELTPYFAKAWNSLDDASKAKFNKASEKEKVSYRKKLAAYKKTPAFKKFQEANALKKLRKKKPKDTNAPKRPTSAYFLFLKEVRPQVVKENQNGGIAVIGKAIGVMWGNLDESKKASYQKKAEALRAKWQKNVATYKKSPKYQKYLVQVAEFKAEMKEKIAEQKAAMKEVEKQAPAKK